MTDLRQAAQQLLEACEQRLPLNGQAAIIDELNNLRTALKQQAEPVAWIAEVELSVFARTPKEKTTVEIWKKPVLDSDVAIYTAQPQRKPLTDEEIDYWIGSNSTKKALVRAIEAAHGIKEGT